MQDGTANPRQQTQRFISLLTANQNRMYSYILMRVPCTADADDILQETTATMWEKFAEFIPGSDFVAWGITIAHYKVLNFRRKQMKINQTLTENVVEKIDNAMADNPFQQDSRIDALKDCMKSLSRPNAEILQMRYAQQLPIATISVHTGKATKSVYRIIARIHQSLLDCVKGKMIAEDK